MKQKQDNGKFNYLFNFNQFNLIYNIPLTNIMGVHHLPG